MAGLLGQVAFGDSSSVSLSAATTKTVVVVTAPTNQRVKLLGYGFFFDGTLNSAQPVQVEMRRGTAAGTSTGATPQPNEGELTETFQSTWGTNCSAEPTYTQTLKVWTVHPQLGYEYLAPLGQEIVVKGGQTLGFPLTAPATVDVRGYVMFDE